MEKTKDGLDGIKSSSPLSDGTIEQDVGSLSVNGSTHHSIRTSDSHLDYLGATHWSAILENVRSSHTKSRSPSLTITRFAISRGFSSQK